MPRFAFRRLRQQKSTGFMHYVEEADTTFSHRRPIHHAGLDPPKAGSG